MDNERLAGGLLCSEVLDKLSSYMDGELAPETMAAVEAHLGACDNCLRFGGSFQKMLTGLRGAATPVPPELVGRLNERLGKLLSEEPES